jgi:protein phosphatase
MKAVCGSDIGLVRIENQDRVTTEYLDNAVLAVLCDGMGGANCGSEASTLAINAFVETFKSSYREYFENDNIKDLLVQCMENANSMVYSTSLTDENKFGMGTTCVCALLTQDGRVFVANVGDSRAYIITNNEITQITIDHNYSQYLYSIGQISKEDLPFHPDRNMLIRAVGVENQVATDYFELFPVTPFKILLCSDGLHGFVDMNKAKAIIQDFPIEKATSMLIELANNSGGRDNVSVAILQE